MTNPQTNHARYVVMHEDDVGVSHGSNTAFIELFEMGICSAGSVMVPCPWFPETAALARAHPELDLGVHLTLNSDMGPVKWRPLTGVKDNGLCGPDGYFQELVPDARRADPAAVDAELRAQVDAALNAGIDVTHLDCHMGTAMMPEFVAIYEQLGADYRLPTLMMADFMTYSPIGVYAGPATAENYEPALAKARARGNPIFDLQLETDWEQTQGMEAAYRAIFTRIPEGMTYLTLHFNSPGDIELMDNEAHIRIGEYQFFRSPRGRALMDEFGLIPIGMRQFRDKMRAG
jgi:predicted glycoside hydrolase/deacetylase ChbG (UPF0249 family)